MKRPLLFAASIVLLFHPADGRQPSGGYRGFFEWSSSLRTEQFYTGFSTSHGYQLNPMFFVGAGLGMERCTDHANWLAPVFVHGRIDLGLGKFTPFGDIRLGANLADGAGVYFSPSVGYRFNFGHKPGLNIGAGLTLAGYRVEYYEGSWTGPDSYEIRYVETRHKLRPYFSFRCGIDF